MRIFLTGVSCVGKTTIGGKLAALLGYRFFDLDKEIEAFFGQPLERLQAKYLTPHTFRKNASEALKHILAQQHSKASVIALPPSGLMDSYNRVIKRTQGTVVVLKDDPENILARITFYDADSRLIEKRLTEDEKRYYLREIKKDVTYFGRTYKKADITVDISGLGADESAAEVKKALEPVLSPEAVVGP